MNVHYPERIEGNPGIYGHNGGPSVAEEIISTIVHDGGHVIEYTLGGEKSRAGSSKVLLMTCQQNRGKWKGRNTLTFILEKLYTLC